jgi:DNA-directed RNA polymerase specialized sigma24 family protein
VTVDLREELRYYRAIASRLAPDIDCHTAEDWAQEAVIAVWQQCAEGKPELAFKAGRYRLSALNYTSGPRRQLGGMSVRFDRHHKSGVDPMDTDGYTQPAEPSIEDGFAAQWEVEALREAIEELPPKLRAYVRRRFWKGADKSAALERQALALLRERLTGG